MYVCMYACRSNVSVHVCMYVFTCVVCVYVRVCAAQCLGLARRVCQRRAETGYEEL